MNLEEIRLRFSKEDAQMKLAHLAADLLRIANLIESESSHLATPFIYESKFFAEWAAPEVNYETQSLLSEMQSFLALTELEILEWGRDEKALRQVASQCRIWSKEFLKRAGFPAE